MVLELLRAPQFEALSRLGRDFSNVGIWMTLTGMSGTSTGNVFDGRNTRSRTTRIRCDVNEVFCIRQEPALLSTIHPGPSLQASPAQPGC